MDDKAQKWTEQLQAALANGRMPSGDASKFAGRLNFAAQSTIRRLGRAMVRRFYSQQYAPLPAGRMGAMLQLAIKWWLHVLKDQMCQALVRRTQPEVVELFGGAPRKPARVASVLFDGGEVLYSDWEPTEQMLSFFYLRKDNQIMGLEVLAVALGLSTFAERLRGKTVRVWIDSAGGEGALRAGSTKSEDHNLLIHGAEENLKIVYNVSANNVRNARVFCERRWNDVCSQQDGAIKISCC